MVKHETSKPSYEVAQSGILSSDIFLSVEGRPVNVGLAPLETHKHVAEQVPSEVANIPFKAVKHPDDIDPGAVIMRSERKHNVAKEALKIGFSNILSTVVDYGKTKEQSKPVHDGCRIFQSHK